MLGFLSTKADRMTKQLMLIELWLLVLWFCLVWIMLFLSG